MNAIIQEVNDLAYNSMGAPIASVDRPSDEAGEDDSLGALLVGILGNLIKRLPNFSPGEDIDNGVAVFASDLACQAEEYEDSAIWRVIKNPPLKELGLIKTRLIALSNVLHELRYDHSTASILALIRAGKKGGSGKRIHAASIKAKFLAEQRLSKTLKSLEKDLKNEEWTAKCFLKPTAKPNSHYWPAVDIAVVIEISDFEEDMEYLERGLLACKEVLGHNWIYCVVPAMSGVVLAEFAMQLSCDETRLLPDSTFAVAWRKYIKKPCLTASNSIAFDKAFNACDTVSAIINARNIENLLPEEDAALAKSIDNFEVNHKAVADYHDETDIDYFALAAVKLGERWSQIVQEHEDIKDGKIVEVPLCMNTYNALRGIDTDEIIELGVLRMALRQEELLHQVRAGGMTGLEGILVGGAVKGLVGGVVRWILSSPNKKNVKKAFDTIFSKACNELDFQNRKFHHEIYDNDAVWKILEDDLKSLSNPSYRLNLDQVFHDISSKSSLSENDLKSGIEAWYKILKEEIPKQPDLYSFKAVQQLYAVNDAIQKINDELGIYDISQLDKDVH